jgi:mannose-6-phosphate isomerase-like protein (cupin superfamily)
MAGYTHKNFKDVEDQATKFELSPQMEARFPRDDLEAERTGVSYQRFAPSFRQPFAHRHHADEELYVVVGGNGQMLLDGDLVELVRWDVVRVAPETARAFAAGPEGLEVLAFGTHSPDDVEMLTPEWPEGDGSGESAPA